MMSELGTAAAAEAADFFSLRKTWVDTVPGIEMVELHYAWTPVGGDPDWETGDSRVLTLSASSPRLRSTVIEVPRRLDGELGYHLHHFFFVVHGTERRSSPVVTEEIVAREVTYDDESGRWTSVGIGWAVSADSGEPPAPNYTSARLEGLGFQDAGGGAPAEPASICEFVRAQPLPHRFRGLVYGPRGGELRYVFHLVRAGSPQPDEDTEVWEDADGTGWSVIL